MSLRGVTQQGIWILNSLYVLSLHVILLVSGAKVPRTFLEHPGTFTAVASHSQGLVSKNLCLHTSECKSHAGAEYGGHDAQTWVLIIWFSLC